MLEQLINKNNSDTSGLNALFARGNSPVSFDKALDDNLLADRLNFGELLASLREKMLAKEVGQERGLAGDFASLFTGAQLEQVELPPDFSTELGESFSAWLLEQGVVPRGFIDRAVESAERPAEQMAQMQPGLVVAEDLQNNDFDTEGFAPQVLTESELGAEADGLEGFVPSALNPVLGSAANKEIGAAETEQGIEEFLASKNAQNDLVNGLEQDAVDEFANELEPVLPQVEPKPVEGLAQEDFASQKASEPSLAVNLAQVEEQNKLQPGLVVEDLTNKESLQQLVADKQDSADALAEKSAKKPAENLAAAIEEPEEEIEAQDELAENLIFGSELQPSNEPEKAEKTSMDFAAAEQNDEIEESLINLQGFGLGFEEVSAESFAANSAKVDAKTSFAQMAYEDFSRQSVAQKTAPAINQALVANEAQTKPSFAETTAQQAALNVFAKAAVEKVSGQFAPIQGLQTNSLAGNVLQNLNLREAQALQQQANLIAEDLLDGETLEEQENEQERMPGFLTGVGSDTTRPGSSAPSLASINYPLRHQQWASAVGKRLVFMINNQLSQAQITLNPEKLGPIQIRLTLDRDQVVSVSMTAHHGATRETLEQAIPRLREMLAEAGIDFDSLDVQDEKTFEEQAKQQNAKQDSSSDEQAEEGGTEKVRKYETDNTVDFYA